MENVSSSNGQEGNVPKLRFPGFEGEWTKKRLSEVATGFDYGMNAAAIKFDGTNQYIRITDIDDESRCYNQSNPVSPAGILDEKYLVGVNDILFARTGASTGKSYLYKETDGKLYFAGFLIRVTVNAENNSIFVFNTTLTQKYNKWVQLTSMRSGQPGINSQEYASYTDFYPMLNEQNKIAKFLNMFELRISKQRQLIETLKKYKRGLLTYAFEEMTLSDDADSTTYLFSEIAQRRKEKYNPDCNVEYPCIELEHIEQGTGRLLGSVSSKTQSSIKTVAKNGDVLFGKLRPYLRKFAFAEQDIVCSSEIWAFVPSKYVIPKYLYYLVQTEHFLRVANISSGTKMPRAEWANIEKEPFDIPYIPNQEKVVSILEAVDKKISVSGDSLRMLLNFRDGLLQQLFI